MKKSIVICFIFISIPIVRFFADERNFSNSIGMKMIGIDNGTFLMGEAKTILPDLLNDRDDLTQGDWDEQPVYRVKIFIVRFRITCFYREKE